MIVHTIKGYNREYNWLYVRPPQTVSTLWYDCISSNGFKQLYFIESPFYYLILYYCNTVCNVNSVLIGNDILVTRLSVRTNGLHFNWPVTLV
jgi:hypothetical protein